MRKASQDSSEETGTRRPLVIVTANSSWNIVNFRSHLVREIIRSGFAVEVMAPADAHSERIADLGARFVPIMLSASGRSPLADGRLLFQYLRHFVSRRPAAVLAFTVKPNIFASLAAWRVGARVINNVSGLGTAFLRNGPLQLVVAGLYRAALARSAIVFFQNPNDRDLFVEKRLVRPGQARLLPGSGVDLDHFSPATVRRQGPFRFLFIGRILWDKGIGEFVAAARQVRAQRPDVVFRMLGFVGSDNRSAVPMVELERWVGEGLIEYLGTSDDVRPAVEASDCIVLPSYREGLPRSLLEAAAMAKPVIATDVPGCRHAVDDDVTGVLCAPRSADDLASAMRRMLALSDLEREKMGRQARKKAEREFDQTLVSRAYLEAIGPAHAIDEAAD